MTSVITVLESATQWVTESVTEPQVKSAQVMSLHQMSRGILVGIVTTDDELVGVIDRNLYSVDSHTIWMCSVVSSTSLADLEAILGCIKRILAQYERVEDEENHFEWQSGEYNRFNNVRHEYHFAIIQKKSAIAEW